VGDPEGVDIVMDVGGVQKKQPWGPRTGG